MPAHAYNSNNNNSNNNLIDIANQMHSKKKKNWGKSSVVCSYQCFNKFGTLSCIAHSFTKNRAHRPFPMNFLKLDVFTGKTY